MLAVVADQIWVCCCPSPCLFSVVDSQLKHVALQEAALAELDDRLDGLMEVVRLSYLIKREGGWGAVCEWGETLSLGQLSSSSSLS